MIVGLYYCASRDDDSSCGCEVGEGEHHAAHGELITYRLNVVQRDLHEARDWLVQFPVLCEWTGLEAMNCDFLTQLLGMYSPNTDWFLGPRVI